MAGLCYAELGAAMPEAGGAYVYLKKAYGPVVAFMRGGLILVTVQPAFRLSAGVRNVFQLLCPIKRFGCKVSGSSLNHCFIGDQHVGGKKQRKITVCINGIEVDSDFYYYLVRSVLQRGSKSGHF